MYDIQASTRRVTKFMIGEAYAWLYQRIVSGEYQTNSCKAGKALLIRIQSEQAVTADTYEEFLSLFDMSPFHRMTYGKELKKSKQITSDSLLNYFVSYNGYILPIGFIKDFFEDDYETQAEIEALLSDFCQQERTEIGLSWKRMLIDLEEKIDTLSKFYPGALKPHPTLIVTRLFYTLMTIAMLVFLLVFLNEVRFLEVMGQFVIDNGFDFGASMVVSETMSSYFPAGEIFVRAGERFTMENYLGVYASFFLINTILFIILLARAKKTVHFISYLISVIVDNIRIAIQKSTIAAFDKKGVSQLQAYFDQVTPELVRGGRITEEMTAGVPASKKALISLSAFDMQKKVDTYAKRHAKYKARGFAYDPDKKAIAMRGWRKGLVSSVLILALVAVIDIPQLYNMVMIPVVDFMSNL